MMAPPVSPLSFPYRHADPLSFLQVFLRDQRYFLSLSFISLSVVRFIRSILRVPFHNVVGSEAIETAEREGSRRGIESDKESRWRSCRRSGGDSSRGGLETSLNAARSDGSEEDSEGSPLLIRGRNDEGDNERQSPVLTTPRERTPIPIGGGAVQTGTSSRGAAVLRRVPGLSFPDKGDIHYEGPAPLVYVPEKCGEFLCQLRGRAKPLPAVKDLIFGSEYEEAARAKLLVNGLVPFFIFLNF